MRYFGNLHTPPHPVAPDTWLSVLLTASSIHAFDWPASCDLFRITVGSTIASIAGPVFFSPHTANAAVATTGGTITSGTSGCIPITGADGVIYQRPRLSTGFSIIAGSSFTVCVEMWKRGGTTST